MSLNGGYAMIKYNSTQEELQFAYRSKKPALFYDENQRAHWAVIEETATQSVDEETQEPITLYKYSYRLLDEESGGSNLLEDIVDKKGNKRFIEGDGTPTAISGITSNFCKWSLSGTHLMIVYAGTLSGSISIHKSTIASFEFPEWILNKILPLNSDGVVSVVNAVFAYEGNFTYKQQKLIKTGNGLEIVNVTEGTVASSASGFRIQFDLLIDSE